ncbi:hypothetical protein M426DRAFT_12536 [Hypoxylon sp. CI-4A]|nr:hypothetical protein M426DRAFT_12536 [Hypoxylon sp. CI-4A]
MSAQHHKGSSRANREKHGDQASSSRHKHLEEHPENPLPGCTSHLSKDSRHIQTQTMSETMMSAYITMRGPSTHTNIDPLFEWMQDQDERAIMRAEARSGKKNILHMLDGIDRTLRYRDEEEEPSETSHYELVKPPIQHINAAPDHDTSLHKHEHLLSDPVLSEWEDDEDDSEGNEDSGRISPCTFLAWSKGVRRWNNLEIQDPDNVLEDAARTRPLAPTASSYVSHYPHYLKSAKSQVDQYTGEEISPWYNVPHTPSIVFTPPGVPDNSYAPVSFLEKYTHMAPDEAKQHRNHIYGKAEGSYAPAGTNEKFTESEVKKARDKHPGHFVASLPNSEVEEFIETQQEAIQKREAEEKSLRRNIELQNQHIAKLEEQRELLQNEYIPRLHEQRTARTIQRAREQADRLARDNRIREHIGYHIRDNQYLLDNAFVRQADAERKFKKNQALIDRLQAEIDEECMLVGRSSPEDVCNEVNGLVSPPAIMEGVFGGGNGFWGVVGNDYPDGDPGPSNRMPAPMPNWELLAASTEADDNKSAPKTKSSFSEHPIYVDSDAASDRQMPIIGLIDELRKGCGPDQASAADDRSDYRVVHIDSDISSIKADKGSLRDEDIFDMMEKSSTTSIHDGNDDINPATGNPTNAAHATGETYDHQEEESDEYYKFEFQTQPSFHESEYLSPSPVKSSPVKSSPIKSSHSRSRRNGLWPHELQELQIQLDGPPTTGTGQTPSWATSASEKMKMKMKKKEPELKPKSPATAGVAGDPSKGSVHVCHGPVVHGEGGKRLIEPPFMFRLRQ